MTLMRRGRAATGTEVAICVPQRRTDADNSGHMPTFVPKPVSDRTSDRRRQILNDSLVFGNRLHRLGNEPDDQAGKDQYGDPVVNRLHDDRLPFSDRGFVQFNVRSKCIRNKRAILITVTSIAAVLASGCNRDPVPTGQVVAIVGGEELTIAELNFEARARGLQIGTDRGVRDALLREMIDRKLLAREAVARGADRSPDHLLAIRRLSEIALGQRLLENASTARPEASQTDMKQFILANPRAFGARVTYIVDSISSAAPMTAALQRALAAAPSVDAMEKIAVGNGLPVRRAGEMWDSAALAEDVNDVLHATPPGDTFVLTPKGNSYVGKVTSVVAQPVPERQRAALARNLIRQKAYEVAQRQSVEQARTKIEIRYQPGFAPLKNAEF